MDIEYKDRQNLNLTRTDEAFAEIKLPVEVVNSLRKKLHLIEQATTELSFKGLSGWDFKQLTNDIRWSIRLNKKYRLYFLFDNEVIPNKVTVLEVVGDH